MIQALKKSSAFEWSEPELIRSITRESFFEFVVEFWDTVVDEPFTYNWHIEYLAAFYQNIAHRVYKRSPKEYDYVVNIPPGSTKTLLTCVLFPAWIWTWWSGANFIGVSHAFKGAERSTRFCRQVIKSDKYRMCYPDVVISEEQDAKAYFSNTGKGEMMSFGVGGNVKGRHADFILADDLFDPDDAYSIVKTDTVNRYITNSLWDRRKNMRRSVFILIMQRLHQNDPTGMLLKKYGEKKICQVCIPGELSDKVKPTALRKFYKHGLMDPTRHGREALDEVKMNGDYYYSGQIMQNPVPLGGGMFKPERIVIDTPPEKWTKVVRYWDTAVSEKKTACYTVGLKMGKNCDGRFWILDVKRGRWGASARRQVIRQTAETDGRNVIVGLEQEPGASGKETAESQAKELAGFRVKLDRPTGDKVVRADSLAAQVNAGNVSMVRGDWNDALIEELRFFPKSTYKDQADAGSGAFKELTSARVGFGVIGVV